MHIWCLTDSSLNGNGLNLNGLKREGKVIKPKSESNKPKSITWPLTPNQCETQSKMLNGLFGSLEREESRGE